MTEEDTAVIPQDVIDRSVAEATKLRDEWASRLTRFRTSARGRMRIGGQWETSEQAEHRLQSLVDHHNQTIKLIEGFRAAYPQSDN